MKDVFSGPTHEEVHNQIMLAIGEGDPTGFTKEQLTQIVNAAKDTGFINEKTALKTFLKITTRGHSLGGWE